MSGYDFEAMNDFIAFGGYGDWYFMNDAEREALHQEKLTINSGQLAAEARKRNLTRINKRKKLCHQRKQQNGLD